MVHPKRPKVICVQVNICTSEDCEGNWKAEKHPNVKG